MANVQTAPGGEVEYSKPADDAGPQGIESLDIERAANGGFVCKAREYSNHDGPYQSPKTYALKTRADLDALLDQLFGAAAAPADDPEGVMSESAGTGSGPAASVDDEP